MVSELRAQASTRRREVCVVFDTNAIWADESFSLVRNEIREAILAFKATSYLTVNWYLPKTVVDERMYQITQRARELLASARRLDPILPRPVRMSDKALNRAIERRIRDEQEGIGLETLPLDTEKIDLEKLVVAALERRAPFESKNEKGFRDSLILESLMQLERRKRSHGNCKLVCITSDGKLGEAIALRANSKIQVLKGLAELREYLAALLDDVDEGFISEVRSRGESLFWDSATRTGLWSDARIQAQLIERFKAELSKVPRDGCNRDSGQWWIYPPTFVGKKGAAITWSTKIENRCTASSVGISLRKFDEKNPTADIPEWISESVKGKDISFWSAMLYALAATLSKVEAQEYQTHQGALLFDVIWKAELSDGNVLSRAQLIDLKHVSTRWDKVGPPPQAPVSQPTPSAPTVQPTTGVPPKV